MGRWGLALGPEVLKQIHERMVRIAQDHGVTAGRRMRVDTTVVETNIHHPTDSTLLGRRSPGADPHYEEDPQHCRNGRNQAARPHPERKLRLLEIGRVARSKGPVRQDRLMQHYRPLLDATSRVVGQAKRFSEEIAQGVKRSRSFSKQLALKGL